jgi:hypothetical protein
MYIIILLKYFYLKMNRKSLIIEINYKFTFDVCTRGVHTSSLVSRDTNDSAISRSADNNVFSFLETN